MKRISRRTLLRGMGAAMGLPVLEAMGLAQAAGRPPVRMAVLYMANGVNANHWTPKGTGAEFELSAILQPLAKLKSEILVLTELTNSATHTGDGHYVKTGGFLTGTTITRTTGGELRSNGTSMDQVAAQRVGNMTPLPSLELGLEPPSTGVDTNVGYTRLYGAHISWSTPTTPIAKEINPQLAFDRLFRSNARASAKDPEGARSVLDLVLEDAKGLKGRVGANDKRKLDEYLDSVRAVEKRIEFDAQRRKREYEESPEGRKTIDALGGRIKDHYLDPAKLREKGIDHTEHVRLMLDLMVLAFWSDSTRVCTFMFGNAVSGKNFSFLEGVQGGHHQISHHENNPEKLEQYKRIGVWHLAQYACMLEKMRAIKEGEGTLLDHSMVLFGAGLRDGNSHNPNNLPIVLAGRGGGALKPGRHLVFPSKTPLCNLYRSMLKHMGAPVEAFADSTGELAGLEG